MVKETFPIGLQTRKRRMQIGYYSTNKLFGMFKTKIHE